MLDQRLNGSDISETGVKPFTYRGSNLPSESLDPYFLRFHFLRHSSPSSEDSHWSESSPSSPLIGCSVHSSHPRASYLIKLKHSHLSYHLKSPRAATLSLLLFTDIAQTWSPAFIAPEHSFMLTLLKSIPCAVLSGWAVITVNVMCLYNVSKLSGAASLSI